MVEDVFLDAYLQFNHGKKMKQKNFTLFARLLAVLLGLIIIGLAFLLKYVPSGVLTMAFSIFGAVGGPIFTVFTLGILFPFVNKWGALFGFLASLVTGIGMALGAVFAYTYKECVAVPLTNASCPLRSTPVHLNTTAPPCETYEWSFFNLSSLYYTPLCLIVGILISFPISFCTGLSSKRPVSHSLMAWQAVKLYSHLPSCVPPQSTNVPVTSSHAMKLCAIVDGGSGDLGVEESDVKEKEEIDLDDDESLSVF
ncbi:unnamed protein product [Dibothriocephalus latus]|uniref:Uncharacterized protein n=1 Tax=Dibothriocephalus latus TaxID=60516 RepID=A0A3P6UVE5_DIBLA|nr:unnamed protein product [Dibothriocephalus latus]